MHMSVVVLLAGDAQADYDDLPATMQARVAGVFEKVEAMAEGLWSEAAAR